MSTTPLLGIQELSPSQTGKETTINNALIALEAATNGSLAVSMVGNIVTLSAAQFISAFIFRCSGQTGAATLQIPTQINGVNTSRMFSVRNSGNYSLTVKVNGSSGTVVTLNPNESRLLDVDGAGNVNVSAQPPSAFAVFSDATTARNMAASDSNAYIRMTNAAANTFTIQPNSSVSIPIGTRVWVEQAGAGRTTIVAGAGVTLLQSSTQAQLYLRAQYSQVWMTKVDTDTWVLAGDFGGLLNYTVGCSAPSNITSNEVLLDHLVVANFTFPADFAGSQGSAGVAPSAPWTLSILKNGTQIGTLLIGTSGPVSFATTGHTSVSFAPGDLLTIQAPSTVDTVIARVRVTLKGTN